MKRKMKIKRIHMYYGCGFPVKLLNVPMIYVRGEWTPYIRYRLLSRIILRELCEKRGRFTGDELHGIRMYLDLTLQKFAKRFGVTHPAVMKWEGMRDKKTEMTWSTEKDIRLCVLTKLTDEAKDMVDLYKMLEEVMEDGKPMPMKIDARKVAA